MPDLQISHPEFDKLVAFGLGQISEGDSKEIEVHLADCEACRKKLEDVPADSLVDLLQASGSDTHNDRAPENPTDSGSSANSAPPLYKRLAGILAGKEEGHPVAKKNETIDTAMVKVSFAGPKELEAHPRYEVLGPLGAGGMGTVYKAKHRLMDRIVALKIVNPLLVTKPGAVDRFIREVKAAAQLMHPNIVTAYDAEKVGEMHILVMECVEGKTLSDVLEHAGELPRSQTCDYVRQTALGLQHALERGMVHRDVKPQNLILTPKGVIKILDFGLARFVSEQAQSDGSTEHGSLMGSPDYMAPEQARDAHAADERADIYSMGCTLYHLLAGQVPFPGRALLEKLEAHRDQPAIALNLLRTDVPAELAKVVEKMMAKDPAQRYQTPAEVATALEPFTQARAVPAVVASQPRKRQPLLWMAAALALLLLATLGYLSGPAVYRFATNKGVVIIETNDDDIEVVVKNNGEIITIIDKKTGHRATLTAGMYEIELVKGKEKFKLSTSDFALSRGGAEIVRVRREPKEKERPPTEGKKPDPHRPTIPSVEELLKTRNVLTVDSDGNTGYKTIQSALDKVQAGEVILVKKGKHPYREAPRGDVPADVALVSLDGARIEVDNYMTPDKEAKWYYGASLPMKGRFRMSGLSWKGFAPKPKDAAGLILVSMLSRDDIVIEKCSFEDPPNGWSIGLLLHSEPGTFAKYLVQDNHFACRFFIRPEHGETVIQRNWIHKVGPRSEIFLGKTGSMTFRHNVVQCGDEGMAFFFLPQDKDTPQPGVDLRIHNNIFDATFAPLGFWSNGPDDLLPRAVTIANNVVRSRNESGVLLYAETMKKVKDAWRVGPNAYSAMPKDGPFWPAGPVAISWPKGDKDLITTKKFLSVDPHAADYLRIAADGPLAKDGADGEFPSYFGAFPPGPAPKDGDWFTRLVAAQKQLAAPPNVNDLLAKAQAAIEDHQYEQALTLANEALRLEPNHIEAIYMRAWPQWHLGKRDLAIQDVTAVLKVNPDHDNARSYRAYYYLNTGKFDECIADATLQFNRHKTGGFAAGALANRGTAYARKGRFDLGLRDYNNALKLSPESIDWHLWRGFIHERLGNTELAAADREIITKKKPEWKDLTNELLQVVPQPMPLAEWLQGRKVLTVARDGKAMFKTIAAALEAVEPGQVIKILDKGPYRESIVQKSVDNIGLVSDVGTRIEIPKWTLWGPEPTDKAKNFYQGFCLHSASGGFRLAGIEFICPQVPADAASAIAVELVVGGIMVESCRVVHTPRYDQAPLKEGSKADEFYSLRLNSPGLGFVNRIVLQENNLEGTVDFVGVNGVHVLMERNRVVAPQMSVAIRILPVEIGETVIRHNVIHSFSGHGIYIAPKNVKSAGKGRFLIANNVFDVFNVALWTYADPDQKDLASPTAVRIQNNIVHSRAKNGFHFPAHEFPKLKALWQVGHNCYRAAPPEIGMHCWPLEKTDLVPKSPQFLGDERKDAAKYLRIAADSPQAQGGFDGDLPTYIGAFPPGPAPKEGDWFTKMLK